MSPYEKRFSRLWINNDVNGTTKVKSTPPFSGSLYYDQLILDMFPDQ